MNRVLQGYITDTVWQDIACMAVHNTVDVWETFVNLAMDMALDITGLCGLLDSFRGFDMVLD